ncbi:histidine utilization repressor [Marinobacterium jannaschii]|uniref:histidine utilization repressor n=1 Tax=Marinobacterium jannaschii TaxID=64970 RepID=UPI000485232F|nr:histidine utilization repressor [Marinobacterium jannaschii]
MSTKPRYVQIKEYLKQAIQSGRYAVGEKIPAEVDLARQFDVSRMTVNKAIRDLVQENALNRHPGLGTFVSDQKAESPLLDVKNIAEEVRLRGHQYSCELISMATVEADEQVAMQLGLPVGSAVYHSQLVHLENGKPIQLEARFVSPAWVPDYLSQDFTRKTPNEYLSEVCPVSNVEHIVEAILPDTTACQLLNISASEPCLLVNRRTWSDSHLISFARLTHPGSRYKLRSLANLSG